jgi:hypothetical protein
MRTLSPLTSLFNLALVCSTVGCGGKVAFYSDGEGGSGAAPTTTTNGGGGTSPVGPNVTVDSSSNSTGPNSSSSTGISPVGGGGPGLTEEAVIEDQFSGTVSLDTTPGTLGVTAVLHASDPFADVGINTQRAPSGALVVNGFNPTNQYGWQWFGAVAMAAPQLDHPETFPFAQGNWSFDYSAGSPARASIWKRSTVDGGYYGGVLDINVFIPDGLIDDSEVTDTLVNTYSDWGGITLGQVRYFSIPDEFFFIDDVNLFDVLPLTEQAPTRPALNIIATGEIGGGFEGAAGFSLGVPGVPVLHGTGGSAIIWQVFYDSSFIDPLILRHEAGHFAGLFHTSEFQPGLGDALSDTPLCMDAGGLLDLCPDYSFAMFPTGGSGEGLFSDKQRAVMQASAIYRGVYAPGEMPMEPYGPSISTKMAEHRQVSEEELVEAYQRTQGRRSLAPATPWGVSASGPVRAYLQGVGCPSGSNYYEELGRVLARTSTEADALIDIAGDTAAPTSARYRAIAMLEHLGPRNVDTALVSWIASDESEAPLVRQAALSWMLAVSDAQTRAEGRQLVQQLSVAADKRLASGARRLLAR